MPIIIKNPGPGIDEFIMLEMQGDLENRDEEIKDCSGAFAGDLLFTKHGQPVLIIGHHILHGKEKLMEKPFALLEKSEIEADPVEPHFNLHESIICDSQPNKSFSILDSTVNIENRSKTLVEYNIRGIIKKKLVFSQRPRPIISNSVKYT